MERRSFLLASGAAAAGAAFPGIALAQSAKVSVGIVGAISDAPVFIAQELGYNKDVGIETELVQIASGALMVEPLGTGQLDTGAGGPSAGLYNAALRGIQIKVVADKATTAPGYGFNPLIARTELMTSGKLKKISDLKGMTVANVAPGDSSESVIYTILKKGGLAWDDVHHVHLNFADQVAGMKGGSVDAGIVTEPNASTAIFEGIAQKFIATDTVYPNQQIAAMLYGGPFIKDRPDVARRFMVAYVRALRFYYGALKDGHYAGPNAPRVIDILIRNTHYKDKAVYERMTPNAVNPNGAVNVASMNQDIAAWRALGEFSGNITAERVVDNTFVDAALQQLGRYKA